MDCERYKSILDTKSVESLSELDLKAFHSHSQTCSSCKSHFEAQEEMNAMLDNYNSINLKAPVNLSDNVMDRIYSGGEKSTKHMLNYAYRLLAIAAAFLIGLFLVEQYTYINQITELEQNYQAINTEMSVQTFITEKRKS